MIGIDDPDAVAVRDHSLTARFGGARTTISLRISKALMEGIYPPSLASGVEH